MSVGQSEIATFVHDPATAFHSFDTSSLNGFSSVWKTRLIEATEIRSDASQQQRAQAVLNFITDIPASDLRLYVVSDQKLAFLYRVSTCYYLVV